MDPNEIQRILGSSKDALADLDRFESDQSLLNFMTLGWHALEPGVKFVPNYAVYAICDHLEAVNCGQIRRLLINVPPGFSKSMTTCVFFPAWEWGPKGLPHYRYISFSHEQKLAIRDNVRCRDLIRSEWYQANWGDSFSFKGDQNAKVYYENDKTGWRQACAAEGLTGKRGDRVIGDDPHSVKGADSDAQRETVLQIATETVPTRLNSQSDSVIIYIMQRVHERDVSGLILAKELGYEHLMLPMEFEPSRRCFSSIKPSFIDNPKPVKTYFDKQEHCWRSIKSLPENVEAGKTQMRYNVDVREKDGQLLDPIRFPKKAVEELKESLRAWGGTYAEAGQLQQRPVPRGGGMFKKADFKFIDTMAGMTGTIVRGWDLAASDSNQSPYTAGVKMMMTKNKEIVIMDVNRFKKTPGLVEMELLATANQDGKLVRQDYPQDPGQAGKAQKATLGKLLHGFTVTFSPESGSKEIRALGFAAQVECGNVYLLRGPWNDSYLNEVCLFPNGQFKDQTDASSRAYAALIRKRAAVLAGPPKLVEAGS